MRGRVPVNELRNSEGRGRFLTTLLVFAFLLQVNNILQFLIRDVLHLRTLRPLYVMEQFVILPLYIVILLGILRWKKVAVYASFLLPMAQLVFINTLHRF